MLLARTGEDIASFVDPNATWYGEHLDVLLLVETAFSDFTMP